MVPPISKLTRSLLPVSLPKKTAARAPAAGPDSARRMGKLGGGVEGRDAAAGEHEVKIVREAALFEVGLEALEVAFGERLDVGVRDGGAHAFVFADLWADFTGDGDADVGKVLGEPVGDKLFVRRVGEGMQEANRNRFDVLSDTGGIQLRHQRVEVLGLYWRYDMSKAIESLVHLEPHEAGH